MNDALITSLYSQLFEEAVANACMTLCPGIQGTFTKENRRNSFYWYWVGRDNNGKSRRVYIGPDNKDTENLVAKLQYRKDRARQAIDSMKRTAAAYRGAGGQINEPSHFKTIALLAQQNLFRKKVYIIGSQGFISICNALGISADTAFLRANEFVSQRLSIAIPDVRHPIPDIPAALKKFDDNFKMIPELDEKNRGANLSTSLEIKKTKVDFLTADRETDKPVYFDDLGIAAQPMRFMDFLLGGEALKGLFIGRYAIPVTLPNPARFAIHKLIISQERPHHFKTRSQTDIAQAAILLEYLIDEDPGQVFDALSCCLNIDGAINNIKKSLPELGRTNILLLDFFNAHLGGNEDNQ